MLFAKLLYQSNVLPQQSHVLNNNFSLQETKDFAENTQRILVRPKPRPDSPAAPTQAQQTASFYASAADEDEDLETLHSTWVIPLDETPGKGAAVIVVTAEDTKL